MPIQSPAQEAVAAEPSKLHQRPFDDPRARWRTLFSAERAR